jgi:UDP-GlcNAc:undecaprenyl-phosphate GlcNAc-1-phosphate transferase
VRAAAAAPVVQTVPAVETAVETVVVESVVATETPAMAELSAKDQELLGRLGTGAHAVGDHPKS